jgi:hypothetical protein
MQAGARPSPAEFAFDALKQFAQTAGQPEYQEVVRMLTGLCGQSLRPWAKRKGVFNCALRGLEALAFRYFDKEVPPGGDPQAERARRDRLLELLQAEVREAGFCVVLSEALGHRPVAKLRLFPTAEKFAVLAACGTNGVNYGHTTRDVSTWLLDLDRENPFVLTECSFDFVGGKFLEPIHNSHEWAERMLEFCPDLDLAPESLAHELERAESFGFWWD